VSGSDVRNNPSLPASSAPAYRPRRPEDTTLYRIVVENLETFVEYAREHYERRLPRYVENEFRDYLKCGVFSFGVAERVVRWLDRKGLLDISGREEERSNVPETPTSLDACARVALATGGFGVAGSLAADAGDHDDARWSRREQRFAAEYERFNLHAGVHLPAAEIESREKLYRYALRPCFALERLTLLPDGRVAYRVKAPRSRRATHRLMTPLEFMARASALIPPPRFPLVRYHGVLAPNSPYRSRVVPRAPDRMTAPCRARSSRKKSARKERDPDRAPSLQPQHGGETALPQTPGPPPHRQSPAAPTNASSACGSWPTAAAPPPSSETASPVAFQDDACLPPNVLPIAHWERLLGGLLLVTSPRLDWAMLMRRTYATDVLQCSQCHGRLRVLAAITAPEVARQILARLGVPTAAPQPARARDPTWDDSPQTELPWPE